MLRTGVANEAEETLTHRDGSLRQLIAASGVLGVLMAIGFNRLERITLRWHPSQRQESAE